MNAKLLIYNFEGKELKALKTLCAQNNVRLRRVLPEEYSQPIGAFCGVKPHSDSADARGEEITERMMVFANFGGRQTDAFLSALRTARVGVGALKAMLTLTNADWDSHRLCAELSRERDNMLSAMEAAREASADAAERQRTKE